MGSGAYVAPNRVGGGLIQNSISNTNNGIFSSDPNLSCPTSANILPKIESASETDGSDRYFACFNKSSDADIVTQTLVLPRTSICAYPVQEIDADHRYWKVDPVTRLPLSVCKTMNSGGTLWSFQYIQYNSLILVQESKRAQMNNCLSSGNASLCPAYSYGKFR
jgi:hypothetical protein